MTKVAILTLPFNNNYGGILQNFALQKYLKKKGFDVCTVLLDRKKQKISGVKLCLSIIKRSFYFVLGGCKYRFINPNNLIDFLNNPGSKQRLFINNYISTINFGKEISFEVLNQHNIDAVVVGSDQVWRPKFVSRIENYYLDFSPKKNIKKIAFSASFGVDVWESTASETEKLKMLARDFDFISVREASGVAICKEKLGIDVCQTIDPTMLLAVSDYIEVIKDFNVSDNSKVGVCAYLLDNTLEKRKILERIAEVKKSAIYEVGGISQREFESIESWLYGIYNSDFVVTDSFHGVIFSLIFKKDFVCIGNGSRGLTRFESILKLLNLDERLVLTFNDYLQVESEVIQPLNYSEIDPVINKIRNSSENYILKALE